LHTYIATVSGYYSVYVYESDGCGSLSDTLNLTQGSVSGIAEPQTVSQSGGTEICGSDAGILLSLTTVYTGTNISYQWFKDAVPVSGATSAHYYARASGDYMLFVEVDGCSAQSSVLTVSYDGSGSTVKPDLKSNGDTSVLCSGTGSLLLYVSNTNSFSSSATYVWYKDDFEILRGVGLHTYIATVSGSYSVYVYESDGCGSLSDTLNLTQGSVSGIAEPQIVSQSGGTEICGSDAGILLSLTTVYTGTDISYQWFKDAVPVSGATSAHYYARASGDYMLFVEVDGCSAQSNIISITYDVSGVMPLADLRSENNSEVLCAGSSILLYVDNLDDYSDQATYVWYDNDVEIARGEGMYSYSANESGIYSVMVFEPNGCLSISADTIAISEVDSLLIDYISSSMGINLLYNESTDLTVEGVDGGISPYNYTWYKKHEGETAWTEIYSGHVSTLTTGGVTTNTCYKVIVSSSDSLLTCNYGIDSICIEVPQIELALEFMSDIYSICNSAADSISIKLTNSKQGFATNIQIEFMNDGALPSISPVFIDSLAGNSDTVIVIYLPDNTYITAQSGLLKAEIISCDQNDANPLTVYGNWKNTNWLGDPTQADEDVLHLTVYPNVRLTSKLHDTICSEAIFNYEPLSNIAEVSFSWERLEGYGIEYATGAGAISEVLTNINDAPITVTYIYTMETDLCPSAITDTVTVVILPKGNLALSHYPENGNKVILGTPIIITANLENISAKKYIFTYANDVREDTVNNMYEIYVFNESIINEVNVQVEGEYGCVLTGTEIFINEYNLPNLITPNENTNSRLLKGYDIQIFNRWGSQLYSGTDGWDGRYKGTLVVAGTYFYVVNVTQPDGKRLTLKRSVYVKY
jgi:uncharacterized protein YneR